MYILIYTCINVCINYNTNIINYYIKYILYKCTIIALYTIECFSLNLGYINYYKIQYIIIEFSIQLDPARNFAFVGFCRLPAEFAQDTALVARIRYLRVGNLINNNIRWYHQVSIVIIRDVWQESSCVPGTAYTVRGNKHLYLSIWVCVHIYIYKYDTTTTACVPIYLRVAIL